MKGHDDIKFFHYTDWPDHDVNTVEDLVSLAKQTVVAGKGGEGPIFISCSAGVGRSGTLSCAIQALQDIQSGERFSTEEKIIKYAQSLMNRGREVRTHFVQTDKQFELLCKAITTLSRDALIKDLSHQFVDTEVSGENKQVLVDNLRNLIQTSSDVKKDIAMIFSDDKIAHTEKAKQNIIECLNEVIHDSALSLKLEEIERRGSFEAKHQHSLENYPQYEPQRNLGDPAKYTHPSAIAAMAIVKASPPETLHKLQADAIGGYFEQQLTAKKLLLDSQKEAESRVGVLDHLLPNEKIEKLQEAMLQKIQEFSSSEARPNSQKFLEDFDKEFPVIEFIKNLEMHKNLYNNVSKVEGSLQGKELEIFAEKIKDVKINANLNQMDYIPLKEYLQELSQSNINFKEICEGQLPQKLNEFKILYNQASALEDSLRSKGLGLHVQEIQKINKELEETPCVPVKNFIEKISTASSKLREIIEGELTF